MSRAVAHFEGQHHDAGEHDQADEAERRYYRSLSGQQRLDILLELISRYGDAQDEATGRLERVYRIIKLGER